MACLNKSSQIALIGVGLLAFILCQGQSCAPVSSFKVVGSPDPNLDGTYEVVFSKSGSSSTTEIALSSGVPISKGTGDGQIIIDGLTHPKTTTNNGQILNYNYRATGDAGRVESDFTMEIVTTVTVPGGTPSDVVQTMTFDGTIGSNGVISGTGSETVSAEGFPDEVTTYSFTMTEK